MNIIHTSKIPELVNTPGDHIFIYHSRDARDELLRVLDAAGCKWSSGRDVLNHGHIPNYYPRGMRTYEKTTWFGSLEYYIDEYDESKLHRVVL
jgi:hypothetical protein